MTYFTNNSSNTQTRIEMTPNHSTESMLVFFVVLAVFVLVGHLDYVQPSLRFIQVLSVIKFLEDRSEVERLGFAFFLQCFRHCFLFMYRTLLFERRSPHQRHKSSPMMNSNNLIVFRHELYARRRISSVHFSSVLMPFSALVPWSYSSPGLPLLSDIMSPPNNLSAANISN